MPDSYAGAAEHFDLITKPYWSAIGPALHAVLRQAGDGPVVDIGTGTGLGLPTIGKALPAHEIIAIEPSPSLRIGLFSRLADHPELAKRVTVLPTGAQEAELPPRLGAVVGINMLGHLSPADRATLWNRIAASLAPGAPAVFTLQPPDRPASIPESPFGEAVVGRLRYSASGSAEPSGEHQVTWRVTYRVHDGATQLSEQTMEHCWWTVSEGQLDDELHRAGLAASSRDGLVVIHQQ
ncbi:class I SAM-dependent methyltransferase [Lentzea sp. BCCO 10_0798]|uniref:Class I SAM-dependent methyltransferase n=1 Tax=Lentzea kristufekii TaxID=3095430 RepID=A0ABU4U5F7_9PSEU|nr:class I SAM-dependent methyltransferase [Lentzea sp. BCCO 10_0798]MDX8055697.1 class I SAM-dependent methyltransferase [Lentzea sp. BCCO 10_0798]